MEQAQEQLAPAEMEQQEEAAVEQQLEAAADALAQLAIGEEPTSLQEQLPAADACVGGAAAGRGDVAAGMRLTAVMHGCAQGAGGSPIARASCWWQGTAAAAAGSGAPQRVDGRQPADR